MKIKTKDDNVSISLTDGISIPFILIIFLLGVGLGWWEFTWFRGFIAVLLEVLF